MEVWNLEVEMEVVDLGPVPCGLTTFLWETPFPPLHIKESGMGGFSALQPPKGWEGDLKLLQGPAGFMTS